MAHNYRNQNEPGRSQDYPRSGQRSGSRDRYETGNERRYSPDWDERFYESASTDDMSTGYAGNRTYAASGYPEEFGYRRDNNSERERHSQRPGGSYYERPFGRTDRNFDYGARDSGPNPSAGTYVEREPTTRFDFNRGEDFNHSGYYASPNSQARDSENERSFNRDAYRQTQQHSYRGRGPKGYERSDERLREMICERLTDDPNIDASDVTVEVSNKIVKLTGNVEERRIKYLIEDVIEQCGGVRDIDNQLRVQPQGQSQSTQYGSGTDTNLMGRGTDKSAAVSTKRN